MSSSDLAAASPASPASPDAQYLNVPFKTSLSSPGLPLSPPPPSIKDDDTEILVDQELAKRLSKKGWHRISFPHGHSPVSPFSAASSKTNNSRGGEGGESAEGSDENAGATRPSRVIPRRTLTDGSVKLERITHDVADQTSPQLKDRLPKAVYRYVDIYENQRG
jgi:hypothetical protein